MQLSKLLKKVSVQKVIGKRDVEVKDICSDSRNAGAESLFAAIKGNQIDGHSFIDVVPAKVIVCETLPTEIKYDVTYIQVENSRLAWAMLSANYFGNPGESLIIVGVTGTNGKSSVVTLLYNLFNKLYFKVGLLSTISYKIGQQEIPATHTTPDAYQIHKLLRQMVDQGCTHCFMEVSSHALSQDRTEGVPFNYAIFTNITHDHLDYHGDFQSYIKAKKILFDNLHASAIALINIDDRNARIMVQNTKSIIKTFGVRYIADYKAKVLENEFEGLRLDIDGFDVWFRVLGRFNAYNLLAVYGVTVEMGIPKDEILKYLSMISGAEGRMEIVRVKGSGITGIVDYSHTPDSLENVLITLEEIAGISRKIITVVGCGGDRDKEKRPKMGKIASVKSHFTILTSDNPRNEDPSTIINEMYAGIDHEKRTNILRIESRKEGIKAAVSLAQGNDIVLVAGKGHETYQEIRGIKHPFDDREILREILNQK